MSTAWLSHLTLMRNVVPVVLLHRRREPEQEEPVRLLLQGGRTGSWWAPRVFCGATNSATILQGLTTRSPRVLFMKDRSNEVCSFPPNHGSDRV